MKRVFAVAVAVATVLPAQAQLFSYESFNGAVFGGLVGGIIGHNSGRRTAEGIGIGAGAGWLLGTIAHDSWAPGGYYSSPAYVSGYGPGYYGYGPGYYGYYYGPPGPNYAVSGAVLGGLAGGIIGHNNGRRTAEGVGIGVGAGLLLGSIADQNARQAGRPYYAPTPVYLAQPQVVTSWPRPAATIGNAPGVPSAPLAPMAPTFAAPASASGSMAAANALFGR